MAASRQGPGLLFYFGASTNAVSSTPDQGAVEITRPSLSFRGFRPVRGRQPDPGKSLHAHPRHPIPSHGPPGPGLALLLLFPFLAAADTAAAATAGAGAAGAAPLRAGARYAIQPARSTRSNCPARTSWAADTTVQAQHQHDTPRHDAARAGEAQQQAPSRTQLPNLDGRRNGEERRWTIK